MADIELVIKIPERIHYGIEKGITVNGSQASQILIDAVKNGTPLPKGHGRLIDADKTISKICGSSCGCHLEECGHDKHCHSVTRISSAQTIIEADGESEV